MPIEILGKTYLSEAEFAERLGSTVGALRRLRHRDGIGYQRVPGRRGAFYGPEHITEIMAAFSVPSRRKNDSSSENSGSASDDMAPQSCTSASPMSAGCASTLDDIRRASAILAGKGWEAS